MELHTSDVKIIASAGESAQGGEGIGDGSGSI
jgi:hypothetical protein